MKNLFFLLLAAATLPTLADDEPTTGRQLMEEALKAVTSIDTATLQKRLKSEPDLVLVDVRTRDEVRMMGGTIDAPGNVVIPRGWLEFRIQQHALDADTPIVVYCGANFRSPLAARKLQLMGYRNVANYTDGFIGWRDAGLPIRAEQ